MRGYTISERKAGETVDGQDAGLGQGPSLLEAMMNIFLQKMVADDERERRREEREERERLRKQALKKCHLKLVQLLLEKISADVVESSERSEHLHWLH